MTRHLSNQVNPTPDFTSIYVILRPTYASIHHAMRSAPLVVGRLLGVGFEGVIWLSLIALSALTYWALCAFVERRYAVVGALRTCFVEWSSRMIAT